RIDQHRGVTVETDHRTVGALDVLADAHHHGLHDLAFFHAATRDRLLDRNDDDVADRGVLSLGAAEHLDAHDAARAGIVRHVKVGLHLDHEVPRTSFLRVWFLQTRALNSVSQRLGRTSPPWSRPSSSPNASRIRP